MSKQKIAGTENAETTEFSPITQVFHWLTAIVVLVAFVYGPGGPESRVYSPELDASRHLHETLGVAVIVLTILRLLWNFVDARPQPIAMARHMQIASKAVQGILYLLLLAVPITAIIGAWLTGHTIVLLGEITFEPPIEASNVLGRNISDLHGWLGDTVLWLAGAHAAAALYHHAVLKDSVLLSMLPAWAAKRLGH